MWGVETVFYYHFYQKNLKKQVLKLMKKGFKKQQSLQKFIDIQRWNSKKSVLNQLVFSWSSRNLKRGDSNEDIIFHPTEKLMPRGWSYNVLQLKNDIS